MRAACPANNALAAWPPKFRLIAVANATGMAAALVAIGVMAAIMPRWVAGTIPSTAPIG